MKAYCSSFQQVAEIWLINAGNVTRTLIPPVLFDITIFMSIIQLVARIFETWPIFCIL